MSSNETITTESGRRGADPLIIAALAGGCTYDEAAQAAGVSKATVKRRMQDLDFKIQVGEARIETAERVKAVVLAASVAAVGVVTELMQQAQSETVRLSAARTLLQHAEVHHYVGHEYIKLEDVQTVLRLFIELAERGMSAAEHERLVRDCYALVESAL